MIGIRQIHNEIFAIYYQVVCTVLRNRSGADRLPDLLLVQGDPWRDLPNSSRDAPFSRVLLLGNQDEDHDDLSSDENVREDVLEEVHKEE